MAEKSTQLSIKSENNFNIGFCLLHSCSIKFNKIGKSSQCYRWKRKFAEVSTTLRSTASTVHKDSCLEKCSQSYQHFPALIIDHSLLYCYTYTLSAAFPSCTKTICNEALHSIFRNNPMAMGCPPFLASKSWLFIAKNHRQQLHYKSTLWVKAAQQHIYFLIYLQLDLLENNFCFCIFFNDTQCKI